MDAVILTCMGIFITSASEKQKGQPLFPCCDAYEPGAGKLGLPIDPRVQSVLLGPATGPRRLTANVGMSCYFFNDLIVILINQRFWELVLFFILKGSSGFSKSREVSIINKCIGVTQRTIIYY